MYMCVCVCVYSFAWFGLLFCLKIYQRSCIFNVKPSL